MERPQGTKRKHEHDQPENGVKKPRLGDETEHNEDKEVEEEDIVMGGDEKEEKVDERHGAQKRSSYKEQPPRSFKRPKRMGKQSDEWIESEYLNDELGSELELVDAGFFNNFDDDFNDEDLF
jgi:hypothetical protein